MIYCRLKGGLGNMLFQIAGTLGIAKRYGMNTSFPNLNEHLKYLNQDNFYNSKLKHAEDYKIIVGKINQSPPPSRHLKCIYYPFHYNDIPLNDEDYMIEGFFQSEKYFSNVKTEIFELFEEPSIVKKIIDEKYPQYSGKTTSLHVRRGDYLKMPNYHPTQSMSYYENAMEILKDDTDYFLVFSDDIEWCKENIVGDNIIYIDSEIDYIELFLMSKCNNNIIANSSFSWWGAWLNRNENKKVISPILWFGNVVGENTNDIIPENWIKI